LVDLAYGSSPRERGTACRQDVPDMRRRFIPARAGNGSRSLAPKIWKPVHPRASGERMVIAPSRRVSIGSSPRERGTVIHARLIVRHDRFIPARAGNGSRCGQWSLLSTVHPRASGERGLIFISTYWSGGSSPRERGTGRAHRAQMRQERFIPARAGNGNATVIQKRLNSVHPRASGERSSCRHLIHQNYSIVKERTDA